MDTNTEGTIVKEKRFPKSVTSVLEEKRSEPTDKSTPDPFSGKEAVPAIRINDPTALVTISASGLSGVFCRGVQYYDLRNVFIINNAGMASLIDLLRSLLKKGVEVRFVNVNEHIQKKIKSMGLDHILICK